MIVNDPYHNPSFTLWNRIARTGWGLLYRILFRYSPRPFHAWRSLVLRCFGAKIGKNCHIYPKVVIWAPWNLHCEDSVAIADGVTVYNPSPIYLGSHSIISQEAYLCGASHDYNDPSFPLISAPIQIGAYAWVCARATVQMGITIGDGAVLALGAVATANLEPWNVYVGIPARKVKERKVTYLLNGGANNGISCNINEK